MTLWAQSSPSERKQLLDAIALCDKNAVREWVESHCRLSYGEMSLRRLRIEASKKHIRNVTRKSRCQLIAELKEKQDAASK